MNEFILAINLFPGVFVYVLNKIPFLKKTNSLVIYCFVLLCINTLDILLLAPEVFMLYLSPIACYILFLFLMLFEKNEQSYFVRIKKSTSNILKSIVLIVFIPILEEIIFRLGIFGFSLSIGLQPWHASVLSFLFFVLHHAYKDKLNCLKLIPVSLTLTVLYYFTENIYLCVFTHTIYNLIIYLYNVNKYKRVNKF